MTHISRAGHGLRSGEASRLAAPVATSAGAGLVRSHGGRHSVLVLLEGHGLHDDHAGARERAVEEALAAEAARAAAARRAHAELDRGGPADDAVRVDDDGLALGQHLREHRAARGQEGSAVARHVLADEAEAAAEARAGVAVAADAHGDVSRVGHVRALLGNERAVGLRELDGDHLGGEVARQGDEALLVAAVGVHHLAARLAGAGARNGAALGGAADAVGHEHHGARLARNGLARGERDREDLAVRARNVVARGGHIGDEDVKARGHGS
mmetsp:Transcript_17287/g.58690  ORF Transcript_17287/g.58690 Transcript_17287/m.58690 type:complete len:270 (+) Transcript_17287:82-891(+)